MGTNRWSTSNLERPNHQKTFWKSLYNLRIGKPGYIRIGTVHQGDQDKQKGVYPINAVDEDTQFEVILSVEKISEV